MTLIDAAKSAATGPKVLSEKIMLFVQTAKGLAVDGLTLTEFWQLLFEALKIAVQFLESVPADGAQKKQWAMEAAALVYDELIDKVIPVWVWPMWMMIKPAARPLAMAAASALVEFVLPLLRIAT